MGSHRDGLPWKSDLEKVLWRLHRIRELKPSKNEPVDSRAMKSQPWALEPESWLGRVFSREAIFWLPWLQNY